MSDVSLGGAADKLRECLGEASVNRFHANVWDYLDRDKNGSFDFEEFCMAFAPVIDDDGDYIPALGLYGAQVRRGPVTCAPRTPGRLLDRP